VHPATLPDTVFVGGQLPMVAGSPIRADLVSDLGLFSRWTISE